MIDRSILNTETPRNSWHIYIYTAWTFNFLNNNDHEIGYNLLTNFNYGLKA